jgi:hypothetical protein
MAFAQMLPAVLMAWPGSIMGCGVVMVVLG